MKISLALCAVMLIALVAIGVQGRDKVEEDVNYPANYENDPVIYDYKDYTGDYSNDNGRRKRSVDDEVEVNPVQENDADAEEVQVAPKKLFKGVGTFIKHKTDKKTDHKGFAPFWKPSNGTNGSREGHKWRTFNETEIKQFWEQFGRFLAEKGIKFGGGNGTDHKGFARFWKPSNGTNGARGGHKGRTFNETEINKFKEQFGRIFAEYGNKFGGEKGTRKDKFGKGFLGLHDSKPIPAASEADDDEEK